MIGVTPIYKRTIALTDNLCIFTYVFILLFNANVCLHNDIFILALMTQEELREKIYLIMFSNPEPTGKLDEIMRLINQHVAEVIGESHVLEDRATKYLKFEELGVKAWNIAQNALLRDQK